MAVFEEILKASSKMSDKSIFTTVTIINTISEKCICCVPVDDAFSMQEL